MYSYNIYFFLSSSLYCTVNYDVASSEQPLISLQMKLSRMLCRSRDETTFAKNFLKFELSKNSCQKTNFFKLS